MTPTDPIDRSELRMQSLQKRKNKVLIQRDHVRLDACPRDLPDGTRCIMEDLARRIVIAREANKPCILAMGAHTIKNGLAPVIIHLMEQGWITLVATNGAGIIHDWEFAFHGKSSEDVRENVGRGQFGLWEETGFFINLAILIGAFEGLGYGESVGKFIEQEGLDIPSGETLRNIVASISSDNLAQASAAIDLLQKVEAFSLEPGRMKVAHPFKEFSLQAAARRLGIPFTGHPMIGHDIIYCHPMNACAAIGRAAERDFLQFAGQVSDLSGGVYISIGSAVMSPMVFEKSMSMAQNLAIQRGAPIADHYMAIVDLQESHWDWSKGEPPEHTPDYYLRYCKSFSRMGGTMQYVQADNRDFLLTLLQLLEQRGGRQAGPGKV